VTDELLRDRSFVIGKPIIKTALLAILAQVIRGQNLKSGVKLELPKQIYLYFSIKSL